MVELGGLLAAAILKVVTDQIGSAIGGQIKLQKDFTKDLEKMKMTLESVEALLDDAERRSIKDKSTLLWLKRLKDAMYAISDTIDEYEADTEAITKPSARKFSLQRYLATVIPCLTIGPKITAANEMEKMRKDLEVITDQHTKFQFSSGGYTNELKAIDIRETSSVMETQVIIGRTEEREKILCSLFENMAEEMMILPIYGIGGLGKTTMAKMVYNSSQFKDYSQVWVYVSQTFDLKKIGNSIISQLSNNDSHLTELQSIQNSLSKLLANKKILIVLDDLWEDQELHLDSLKAMLKVGKGSKVVVLVTTRAKGIAEKISTITQPHKLEPLTNDMCWSIIKQKSGFESRGDKEHLEQIGMAIAVKCGGVVLAAQSLGHMLHSMTSSEWESVRNSDFWILEDTSSTHVLASLRLSYSVMPPYLKLCFAYCAIFPKGHKIVKDELIHQWACLGFIEPKNGFSFWQLGERYIRQLFGLSFLQYSESPPTAEVYHEDLTLLTMHDLVHDLASSVMVDEILVAGKHGNTGGRCCHYALLNDSSMPSESNKIRALRFMNCGEIELDGAAFLSVKSLRILDLSECSIPRLPDSIGVLKQLRYLNAPRIQDKTIPDNITRLSKLTYLNLNGSSTISALPESIGDIEGLLYIDFSGCSGIEKLPESLGRLTKLIHLNLSNCSRVGDVSKFLGSLTELQYLNLSYCPNIGELPEALGGLSQLKYLNMSFSSYLEFPHEALRGQSTLQDWNFLACTHLEDFEAILANLEFSQEAEVLGSLTNLEYLNLSCDWSLIKKLPEALGTFVKLKYLNLSGSRHLRGLPGSFVNLKNLVFLDLSNCLEVNDVPDSLVGLTKLEHLNLSRGRHEIWNIAKDQQTRKLSGLPEVICTLTNLRYLNLSSCMDSIFGYGSSRDQVDGFIYGISTLSNLENLDLSSNWHIVSMPQSFCNLRKLHTLDLSHCKYLRMVPESIGMIDSLKFLNLTGCPYLSESPQMNSTSISLPHFAVHPGDGESSSSLLRLQHTDPDVLEITRLENVKSSEEAHRIELMKKHRLRKLKLQWTKEAERSVDDRLLLEELVPACTVQKFQIQGYNSVRFPAWLINITHYLPDLRTLEMHDMPNFNVLPPMSQLGNLTTLVLSGLESLEEWDTSCSSGEGPVIAVVEIHDCPKLRIKPLPPRAKFLKISKSDSVLSSWGQYTGASTTCTTLSVNYCELPMHQWRLLQHLPGLPSLYISDCGDLSGSPEISQHLSSLKSLLLEVRDQQELPEWLDKLTSLQQLSLSNCSGLKELPAGIRQLTGLQLLKLFRCTSIASLPHWLGELTSLSELVIVYCDGISSFPEAMQQLTNLQILTIMGCPALKEWCELEESRTKLAHIKHKRFPISD